MAVYGSSRGDRFEGGKARSRSMDPRTANVGRKRGGQILWVFKQYISGMELGDALSK